MLGFSGKHLIHDCSRLTSSSMFEHFLPKKSNILESTDISRSLVMLAAISVNSFALYGAKETTRKSFKSSSGINPMSKVFATPITLLPLLTWPNNSSHVCLLMLSISSKILIFSFSLISSHMQFT
eukprot:NODE_60_length_25605_cov_0.732377.p12 type:complete len:125 gc:universal NODE_60_length_25605_cov_0.732377:581-207(-)